MEEDALLGLSLPSGSVGMELASENPYEQRWNAMEEALAAAAEASHNNVEQDDAGSEASGEDGAGPAADAEEAGLSDEQLLLISDKKEAKRNLSASLYKRWKKVHKKAAGGHHHESRHKTEKKKRSSKTKRGDEDDEDDSGKSKRKKREKTKRERSPADDTLRWDEALGDESGLAEQEVVGTDPSQFVRLEKRSRVKSAASGATAGARSKTLTKAQRTEQEQVAAQKLISAMRDARARDELGLAKSHTSVPPLHRVALCPHVIAECRRLDWRPLVAAGLLPELSHWLFDLEREEPAPYDLRCAALEILLRLPIEGERRAAQRQRSGSSRNSEDITEDNEGGLCREHLIHTDLGRSVNALRLHPAEVPQNRALCVRLLDRLSRALSGGFTSRRQRDVTWRCKGDRDVYSPFHVVPTASEAFQKNYLKPNPQDPASYHNYMPWRPSVTVVTNLSGRLRPSTEEDL